MPITLPTPELSWRFQLQTRITFTSILQTTGDCIYTIVTRLINEGWTCKGSCDGTTGAMDGVNRITAGNKFQTRFSGAAGAQSWIVLTDGDGADIVFSFNSAADDRVNYWWSPGGHAVAAGTATNEPTATDQDRVTAFFTSSFISMVGTTASADRLVSVWTTADHKNFRVAIARAGAWVICFGKESYTPASLGAGITLHPGYAFVWPGDSLAGSAVSWRGIMEQTTSATAGPTDQMRFKGYRVDGAGASLDLCRGTLCYGQVATTGGAAIENQANVQPPLQGGASYVLRKLLLWSGTSGHEGNVGKMRDWYYGHFATNVNLGSGTTYGTLQWINMNGAINCYNIVWPWDGVTTVVMS